MTYKEALLRLTNTLCEGCKIKNPTECKVCHEAEELMDVLVWKADKYRWHDLRKDPDDLPEERERVLISFGHRYGGYVGYVSEGNWWWWKYDGNDFPFCAVGNFMVIAWREIEPFESEV